MCTLLIDARGIERGILHLGANRDEALDRPSDPPGVLCPAPLVLGGRDRLAGGTWLAIRSSPPRRVVAVLNRPEPASGQAHATPPATAAERRSRGLLCLDAAIAADLASAEREALDRIESSALAPFNLLVAEAGALRLVSFDGRTTSARDLAVGLHVVTHGEPDDRADPRVSAAWKRLEEVGASAESVLQGFSEILRSHDGAGAACRHGDGYGTVSSMLLSLDLAGDSASWRFANGPPCRTDYADVSDLLLGAMRS